MNYDGGIHDASTVSLAIRIFVVIGEGVHGTPYAYRKRSLRRGGLLSRDEQEAIHPGAVEAEVAGEGLLEDAQDSRAVIPSRYLRKCRTCKQLQSPPET
jgi:hypothetical protein